MTAPVSFPRSPHGRPVRGIRCERREFAVTHIHASLRLVFGPGQIAVPAEVGIDRGRGCLYWLHTHAPFGVLHVEAPTDARTFTLGDFFAVWGAPLGRDRVLDRRGRVHAWLNGRPFTGDPARIPIEDRGEIVLADRDLRRDELPAADFGELR